MNEFNLLGGEVVTPEEERFVDLHIVGGQVSMVASKAASQATSLDVSQCYVTPGLIDLQVNGTDACNLWDNPGPDEFHALCQQLLRAGVTAFLPTLVTAAPEHLKKSIEILESMGVANGTRQQVAGERLRKGAGQTTGGAALTIPGIHLEGPFLSPARPGVHPKEFIASASSSLLEDLISDSVKLVTLAPEEKEGKAATKFLMDRGVTVSIGHSNATFAQAREAFKWGIKLMTHTFNALPPLHHRDPGAVGAALSDPDVYCCVIADGLHVDPEMVKLLISIKSPDRIVLVTDVAYIGTKGGGLSGSSIMLCEAVRNLVAWQAASFPEAIRMATINPARVINMQSQLGSIKEAGQADLVVWDKRTLEIKHVVAKGQLIF
jgi:N-acetylglucosamine-6-phosphate deacetylase